MRRFARVSLVLSALTGLCVAPAWAQRPELSGYALVLGTYVGESAVTASGLSSFQRLRGMAEWDVGRLQFDAAYEHTLTERERGAGSAQIFTSGGTASNGDWLDLGGTVEDRESLLWRHRVDRLAVAVEVTDRAELIVGRQPVSWATTLVFTPADPFSPFDPSDPFREYRQGVDAARVRFYPGTVSEVDFVVRRSDFGFQQTTTAAMRGSTSLGGWDVAGWAGVVHGESAGAASLSGAIGNWAVRAEGTVRESEDNGTTLRTALGLDRFLVVGGKDLYLIVEYLHDGFGVDDAETLPSIANREVVRRGELQSVGSDEAALQASYQVHPLVGLSGLVLLNLHDLSGLFAPGIAVSASSALSVTAGAYFSAGDGSLGEQLAPRTEYGAVPGVFYVSLSAFF